MSRPALQTPLGAVADSLDHRGLLRLRSVAAPAFVVGVAVVWWLVHGIDHRFVSFSDGVYMYAAATAAEHGVHHLYADMPVSLPPATMLGAALLWRLSPHIETIRLALAALGAVTALLTYAAARRLFGLGAAAATVAAALALTAPIHAQFVGLDGEALLTPLLLLVALALNARCDLVSAALLGVGFLVKLTWAPYFVAALVAVALRSGVRRAGSLGAGALALALALYAAVAAGLGWGAGDLLRQLVLAESRSGYQLELLPALALSVAVLWWPALVLLRPGLRAASSTALVLMAGGPASALFMLKQGTFFNVLAPVEPLLAIAAVAGASALWRRRRAVVVLCAIGAVLHAASITRGPLGRAFPVPVGAAIVDTDNEHTVDRLAAVVAAHSSPRQRVLVNPFLAIVAGRRETQDAADWFILRSLERYCGVSTANHCSDWRRIKAAARQGRVAVVGVDSNVETFDPDFRAGTGVNTMVRAVSVDRPPLQMQLYVRPPR
jgi:hypothetical protein